MFTERKYDPGIPIHYRDFLITQRLQLIYLDEMPSAIDQQSLEVSLIQLFAMKQPLAFDQAKAILKQAQTENSDAIEQQRVLEWIVTVFVHKFPKLSREEIKTMLGTKAELKKTRFYQEIQEEVSEAAKDEVRLTAIPMLLKAGVAVGEIAQQLDISVEQVKAIAKRCKVKI
jgi:predicted transposase/invertase (TIGR01784 family)